MITHSVPNSFALISSFVIALSMLVPLVAGAQAEEFDPNDIVFPVVGEGAVYYSNTFGAPRSGGRTHEGTDIMSVNRVKGREIVAVADGVIGYIQSNCCAVWIDHPGGWTSVYIHLNNDTPGTDDGLGWGFAPGIEEGVSVVQGQLIGYLGDSGNAEWTAPHLHFELRMPGTGWKGVAISSYQYLVNAPVLDTLEPIVWDGKFRDDDGSTHEADIEAIADKRITLGCNPPDNDRFCPRDEVTRGEMAAFLRRALGLPSVSVDFFDDDDGSLFEQDINALMSAGIGFGCSSTSYCSSIPLGRDEMAEMLVRAFGYEFVDGDRFIDDDGNEFEEAINALAAAGVTFGCNPPTNDQFCPDWSVTREQMASFLVRALP